MRTIKLLVGLLTISFIVSSCIHHSAQNNDTKIETDLIKLNLRGKVKTLKETTFKAIDISGIYQKGDIISKNIISFNDKGYKIEEKHYNSANSPAERYTYKYDPIGNNTEMNVYKPDGNLNYKNIYKYDNKGNNIEMDAYNPDGSLDYKSISTYNARGNKIEEDEFNADGSLLHRSTATYDNKNNIIKETFDNPADSINYKWISKYDNKGNKIEEYFYRTDSNMDYKWTPGNDVNEHNHSGNMNQKVTYKFKYDFSGNWIMKTELKNNIPQTITERETEYY
jgi:hypothetical protein